MLELRKLSNHHVINFHDVYFKVPSYHKMAIDLIIVLIYIFCICLNIKLK